MDNTAKKVAVIMGSDSDLPAVKPAIDKLKSFGVPVEAHVMSAHRTPALAADFAANARKNGFGVIIAAAGKAAHLGGVLAAHTTLPVIGIHPGGADAGAERRGPGLPAGRDEAADVPGGHRKGQKTPAGAGLLRYRENREVWR